MASSTRQMTIRIDGKDKDFFLFIKDKLGIKSDTQVFLFILEQYRRYYKLSGKLIVEDKKD